MAAGLGFALLVVSSILLHGSGAVPENQQFWYEDGEQTLQRVLGTPRQEGVAKNVVLLVGDGMGMSTITAGRIYRGQQFKQNGEEYQLAFEKFPHVGLAKTYNVNAQVGDSAACATALFCGAKTNYHRVGVDSTTSSNGADRCSGGQPLSSLIDWAQKEGKATGLVTNTRLTHSTPSAAYAHTPNRHWESDTGNIGGCKDIARQLVEDRPGRDINVLFGGGRHKFLPKARGGERVDQRNLIDDWLNVQRKHGRRQRHYVSKKAEFDALNPDNTDSVLGLFSPSHMEFERRRNDGPEGEPSLAAMTVKAIQILSHKRHKRGFLLIVEGGRIDHGHHENMALYALTETAALADTASAVLRAVSLENTLVVATADHSHVFTLGGNRTLRGTPILAGRMDHAHHANNAVRALDEVLGLEEAVLAAQQLTSRENTLTVVSADHSHVFTLGGVPPRGNPIFGLDSSRDLNGVPYTTLLYGNGPGYVDKRNLTRDTQTNGSEYRQESAVPLRHETHAGEDVPVYAVGPRSHVLTGTFEQSYVAHAISYAACIGPNRHLCHTPDERGNAGGDIYRPSVVLLVMGAALGTLRAGLMEEAL